MWNPHTIYYPRYTASETSLDASQGPNTTEWFCPQNVRCHEIPLLGLLGSELLPCNLVLVVKPRKKANC